MKSFLQWCKFGLLIAFGLVMIGGGFHFMKHAYLSLVVLKGHLAIPSFLLGIVLLMAGGGLLCSTAGRCFKRGYSR